MGQHRHVLLMGDFNSLSPTDARHYEDSMLLKRIARSKLNSKLRLKFMKGNKLDYLVITALCTAYNLGDLETMSSAKGVGLTAEEKAQARIAMEAELRDLELQWEKEDKLREQRAMQRAELESTDSSDHSDLTMHMDLIPLSPGDEIETTTNSIDPTKEIVQEFPEETPKERSSEEETTEEDEEAFKEFLIEVEEASLEVCLLVDDLLFYMFFLSILLLMFSLFILLILGIYYNVETRQKDCVDKPTYIHLFPVYPQACRLMTCMPHQ